jgi:hypothetical protein
MSMTDTPTNPAATQEILVFATQGGEYQDTLYVLAHPATLRESYGNLRAAYQAASTALRESWRRSATISIPIEAWSAWILDLGTLSKVLAGYLAEGSPYLRVRDLEGDPSLEGLEGVGARLQLREGWEGFLEGDPSLEGLEGVGARLQLREGWEGFLEGAGDLPRTRGEEGFYTGPVDTESFGLRFHLKHADDFTHEVMLYGTALRELHDPDPKG